MAPPSSCRKAAGSISKSVTFAYPRRRPILDHFDLHIEPGQRVGLIGKSGGGQIHRAGAAAAFL